MSSNATRAQGMHTLKLLEDQGLDLEQTNQFHLYLPALAAGAKAGTLPPPDTFRAVCEGRVKSDTIEPKWKVGKDGVIYFSVTSDGCAGPDWKLRLAKQGKKVGDWAEKALNPKSFRPTTGVTSKIAVLPGSLFADNDRITKKIRAEGDRRKLKHGKKINAEVACLIREKFTDDEIKQMGLLWIVVMHKPIVVDGASELLAAGAGDGGPYLDAYHGDPDDGWSRGGGFAFLVPQGFISQG